MLDEELEIIYFMTGGGIGASTLCGGCSTNWLGFCTRKGQREYYWPGFGTL